MTDDRDPLTARVRESLLPLPSVRPTALAEVLARIDAHDTRRRSLPFSRPWATALLAAAAVVLGFVGRGVFDASAPSASIATVPSATAGSASGVTTAARSAGLSPGMVPVQFVYDDASANTVQVVGDFNGWGREVVAMSRVEGSSAWTVVLPLMPGRHLYAFVVNDTQWVADPRAPRHSDRDFGKPESVVMVEAR